MVSLYLLLKEMCVRVQAPVTAKGHRSEPVSRPSERTVLSVPGIVCLEKQEYLLSKSSPRSDQGYIQKVLAIMQKPKDVGYIGSALRIHLCVAVAKTK